MKLAGTVALIVMAGGSVAFGGGLFERVQGPINDLISKNTDLRSTARDKIQEQFDRSEPSDRMAAVDELLTRIKSAPNLPDKVTAAITLSKLKSPWQASDHDGMIKELYVTFLSASDPTYKRYLDDALANAKGLYLDALYDFNNDRVDNPQLTATKFARMPADFPKSRYAASSAYYLGQYWTRVALIRKNFPDNIRKSDDAFTSFIQRAEAQSFGTFDFIADAYYFRALNRILVGKEGEALTQLADIRAKVGYSVYIYQLFYKTGDKSTVVDRYLPTPVLVDATVKFIKEKPGSLPDGQSELAARLNSEKP
jgi:hypothetical protein